MTITYTRTYDEDSNPDSEAEPIQEPDQDAPSACISELLRETPAVGEFTFGGLAKTLPGVPGLHVDGIGLVPLPLVDPSFAARLAECGHLAPFGRGQETLTDMAVRRTWEFDHDQVSFTNPAWEQGLSKLIPIIADRLGCPDMPLELRLYKLLMYESGCHFVRHRDTEKEDRMFATLVIQLPSVHQGGELIVYQPDGTAVTHDFGAAVGTSAFHSHFAVHYADAEHELKAVQSGYRLALVYSLCWPRGEDQVDLQGPHQVAAQLASHLADIAQQDAVFHYFMDHHYTTASVSSLGLKALKGADRDRVRMLQAANDRLPTDQRFSFYLLHGTLTVSYEDEGGYSRYGSYRSWSEIDSSTSFCKLYSPDGRDLSRWIKDNVHLGCLINPDGKSTKGLWRGYSESTVEEYTGNAGVTKDTEYFKFILIAVSNSAGPWAKAPFVGNKQALKKILTEQPNIDSVSLNRILASVPSYVRNPSVPRRSLEGYSNHVATDLLQLILSRSLVDSVPAYFAAFPNPIRAMRGSFGHLYASRDAAKEFALILTAMHSPALWDAICPRFVDAVRQEQDALCFGLQLVFAAADAGIAQATWQPFLESLVAHPVPFGPLERLIPHVARAMGWSPMWAVIRNGFCDMLSALDARLDTGLAIISGAIQHNVPHQVWSTLVPATFAGLAVPTSEVMRNWQLQSKLWRVLVQANHLPTIESVVSCYQAANKPAQLETPVKEILANVASTDQATGMLFVPLLRSRLNWLARKVAHYASRLPANGGTSWRVPTFSFPGNTDIEAFVQSNSPTHHVTGFGGIADARDFLRRLKLDPKNTGGYFTAEATGTGHRARVVLQKTAAARDVERRILEKYRAEHGHLLAVVERFEGQGVPR